MGLDTEKLRRLREEKAWSLEEAADRAGLTSKGHWSDIENGRKSNVKLDTLDKIANALGVRAGELLR